MHYRTMTIKDYEAAIALWGESEGVRLRDADSREGIEKYLLRNPGLSFVAEVEKGVEGKLVGTIMAGHPRWQARLCSTLVGIGRPSPVRHRHTAGQPMPGSAEK
ncbi:hypothetical protein [Halomonas sp. ISL-56]|uniref:hypothetical protein n=1 Tax=Halomonas sp. ISL-56 TaxID=2819149 RepID=UPI002035A892|nr:hypothetical protein [Halomonas sp. ISL-56]